VTSSVDQNDLNVSAQRSAPLFNRPDFSVELLDSQHGKSLSKI